MGRKIFVSYKHKDSDVKFLDGYGNTARAYVDNLIEHRLSDEIYKGEGDEDISKFKDDTIKTRLKDKIHDSSITIVLISPNMKELWKSESEQWIPWEISYSLKEVTRNDRTSHTNGILAVVLPDYYGSYSYMIDESCSHCKSRPIQTNKLFQIIRDNTFNKKGKDECKKQCSYCYRSFYIGEQSYIQVVKWKDFISNKNYYLDKTVEVRDDRKSYNIVKEIK
ncbi:TIR domain-containing protein [Vibrio sp. Of7-15]|uniref:TIR domain-containing protein n=1 Tax=Vibrio sp. Of7-15 TaxID=2724879 RepID=UPI001EF320E7|nr:TIR domain-containing protein [Vibrio sp. Of7-15]MCG7497486.1 TIR domain-containing protein [Vibrio sp. Of7-15]